MADHAADGLVGIRNAADLGNLRSIVAGLSEGVLLIDPDQTILWANDAALRMHGVAALHGLGGTVDEYRRRFELRYRNNHKLDAGEYPIERVMSGETFTEVTVEVAQPGRMRRDGSTRSAALCSSTRRAIPNVSCSSCSTSASRRTPRSASRRHSTPTPRPR